jgi:hypothetical protein
MSVWRESDLMEVKFFPHTTAEEIFCHESDRLPVKTLNKSLETLGNHVLAILCFSCFEPGAFSVQTQE